MPSRNTTDFCISTGSVHTHVCVSVLGVHCDHSRVCTCPEHGPVSLAKGTQSHLCPGRVCSCVTRGKEHIPACSRPMPRV